MPTSPEGYDYAIFGLEVKMHFGARWKARGATEQLTPSIMIDGAEALLRGRVLDEVFDDGGDIPSWAWLNKLAHASLSELEDLVRDPGTPAERPELWVWQRTTAFLAGEVLDAARRSGAALLALQRSILIPLELSTFSEVMGPSTLLRVVLGALSVHGVRQS